MPNGIIWTPHEKQKLADEYQRLREKTNESQEACLHTAMIILPSHRRKNVKDCSSKILRTIGIPAEHPRLKTRKQQPRVEQKKATHKAKPRPDEVMVDTKAARAERVPGPIGLATEQFIGEIAKEVAGIIGLQVLASVRGNVDAALHGMFDRVVKSVSEAVLKEVGEVVRNAVPAAKPEFVNPPAQNITFQTAPLPEGVEHIAVAPRDRTPKVVIIGLMSQQQQEIRKEFDDVCDLTFLQSQTLTMHQLAGKDMAFIMVKFSKHTAETACHSQRVPFYRVTGGVSHLRQEIRKWVNGEIAIAEVSNAA